MKIRRPTLTNILLVDDDENILETYKIQRSKPSISTFNGPAPSFHGAKLCSNFTRPDACIVPFSSSISSTSGLKSNRPLESPIDVLNFPIPKYC